LETEKGIAPAKWIVSFVTILFAMMALQMSSLGFSPLIPAMKHAWGMTYTEVGTFTGVYGLIAILVSVPAGLLAKQYGEKSMLAVGLTLAAIGLVAVSLSTNYPQGLGSRVFWVFGYRIAFIAIMTGVALTAPHDWRGKAMGILGAMAAVATVIGAPFAASIGTSLGWQTAMRAFAGISLLGAIPILLFYKQATLEMRSSRDSDGEKPPGIFSAFRIPVVWAIPLLGLTNAAGFAATFFVPSVVTTQFKLDTTTASNIISFSYAVAIFVNPLCGWLADRFNRWLVMAGMVALMVPTCLVMNTGNIYVFAAATAVLISLGHSSANQVYPVAAELLKGRDIGPIMGVVALGGGVFGYAGPQALGWLRQISGGFSLGWTVQAVGLSLIFLLLLFLKGYVDRTAKRAADA
jgi:predicted MFS family arabinose efflux permease